MDFFFKPLNSVAERYLSGICHLKQPFGMVTKLHIQVIEIKENILLPFIAMLPNDKFIWAKHMFVTYLQDAITSTAMT